MSHIRWNSESDVYIYSIDDGRMACQECSLYPDAKFDCFTFDAKDYLLHLLEHKRAGHRVPDWAIENAMPLSRIMSV